MVLPRAPLEMRAQTALHKPRANGSGFSKKKKRSPRSGYVALVRFDKLVLGSLVETLGFLAHRLRRNTHWGIRQDGGGLGELCATGEFGATGLLITASRLKA